MNNDKKLTDDKLKESKSFQMKIKKGRESYRSIFWIIAFIIILIILIYYSI